MRSFLLFFLFFFVSGWAAQAQRNGSVRAVVFDTLAKKPVPDATITLLARKDSSLISFSMTDNGGRFTINEIAPGDYRLLFSHVAYHSHSEWISITDSTRDIDLGRVTLNDRSIVLDEVLVRSEAPPVTLIGDTVQYNAGSFKTPPNASVEQLLKKLPGVQVDRDGNVKAQGENVRRVLVDGKEFFGDDPKMATKNLPADAIDKVQVYDRQSEQSQLTGFDDGNSEKTINLKLKKDKKKGSFGKVMAGAGTLHFMSAFIIGMLRIFLQGLAQHTFIIVGVSKENVYLRRRETVSTGEAPEIKTDNTDLNKRIKLREGL